MCRQKTVSDAYASATAARASGTNCSMGFDLRTRAQSVHRCVLDKDNRKFYINAL